MAQIVVAHGLWLKICWKFEVSAIVTGRQQEEAAIFLRPNSRVRGPVRHDSNIKNTNHRTASSGATSFSSNFFGGIRIPASRFLRTAFIDYSVDESIGLFSSEWKADYRFSFLIGFHFIALYLHRGHSQQEIGNFLFGRSLNNSSIDRTEKDDSIDSRFVCQHNDGFLQFPLFTLVMKSIFHFYVRR